VPAGATGPIAPTVLQCNPAQSFPGATAGWEVTCHVTVENTVTSTGATSSTVTSTACLTAAGVIPTQADCEASPGYYQSVATSSQLVTSVNQCNYTSTGGGSNVLCDVTVINNVPTSTPTSGVTVDQCNHSAYGGGSTTLCSPLGSTTSATVTQCDYSAYGGGTYAGETTVECSVTGSASALPVAVNQCNHSAYGGGSAVHCTATFTNNFVSSSGGTGSGGSGGTGSGGSSGSGASGSVIPSGAPQTGLGGAAHGSNNLLIGAGVLALIGASGTAALALRRRRAQTQFVDLDSKG